MEAEISCQDLDCCLKGIQLYTAQSKFQQEFLYLIDADVLDSADFKETSVRLLIRGTPAPTSIPAGTIYITVPDHQNMAELINQLQSIFLEHSVIERQLTDVVICGGTLHDICRIAVEYFQTPVYITDEYFRILACPVMYDGVTNFTYNERTKQYMQDAETINYFRTSKAFKKTLKTRGGQFWENELTGLNCAYANLWIDDTYKGRLIVEQLDRPITPGNLSEVGYFAEMITLAMKQRNPVEQDIGHPMEQVLIHAADGIKMNAEDVKHRIFQLDWSPSDSYICGILSFEDSEVTQLSIYGICNEIEKKIQECCAAYHKGRIYLLVNLTKGNSSSQILRMKMSYIIREGLLHMGVSFEFDNIYALDIHLIQAKVALRYGCQENVPGWFNEYREYVLKYWLYEGIGEFTSETIVPQELQILKNYDMEHNTSLYETLEIYLTQERNHTLTAGLLKINRSTLPHRLDRIKKLTGMDLADPNTRLYLLMGFYMMNISNKT